MPRQHIYPSQQQEDGGLKKRTSPHLRCSRDVRTRQSDVGRPGDVAHPVSVALQHVLLHPSLRLFGEAPDFDDVVASSAGESFQGRGASTTGARCQQRASSSRRRPRDGVASDSVCLKHVRTPLSIICACVRQIQNFVQEKVVVRYL
jgi:hypothetical protein